MIGLLSLEHWRVLNDFVLCYITKSGLIDNDIEFVVNSLYTRGHCNKLMKLHCTINAKKFYFSNRVVSIWNSLSKHIGLVSVPSVSTFKIVYSSLNRVSGVLFMRNAWFLFLLFICLCFIDCISHALFALCFYRQC